MLSARDLVLRRGGRVVLAGLRLDAAPGEALLLTGRNGAGKSSTLRALAGLLRPAAGRVLWADEPIGEDPAAHAARLRWVGHGDAAQPAFTVAEELRFQARLSGGSAEAALDALGMRALAGRPVRTLSQGQRRRLALSRLALAPAALWLLDEPSSGLDAASVAALGPMLAVHRARGGILVAATHLPLPLDAPREVSLDGARPPGEADDDEECEDGDGEDVGGGEAGAWNGAAA